MPRQAPPRLPLLQKLYRPILPSGPPPHPLHIHLLVLRAIRIPHQEPRRDLRRSAVARRGIEQEGGVGDGLLAVWLGGVDDVVAAHCGLQAELARGEAVGGGGEGFEAGGGGVRMVVGGGGAGGGRVEPFAGGLREADLAGFVVDVHDDGGVALGPADEAGAEEERPRVVEGVDGAHAD